MTYTSDRVVLQQDIFTILVESECPALTAREIYKLLDPERTVDGKPLSHQLVVGALSAMKVLVHTRHVPMVTKDLALTQVPGRVVGQYSSGMVMVPEYKSHWFLHAREREAFTLKKERRELVREKIEGSRDAKV